MDRLMIISSDGHAGPEPDAYHAYLERRYHEAYDDFLAHPERVDARASVVVGMSLRSVDASEDDPDGPPGPLTAHWTAERRIPLLEKDGIVAEVIFPQPAGPAAPPFYNIFGHPLHPDRPELAAAGCRAYNRWLADFCRDAPEPSRYAGLALIGVVDDVDAAVAEIEWARDAGLRGVILRSAPLTGHGWHDPRYEPIWTACESLEMPVHTHGGEGLELGDLPGSRSIFFSEVSFFAHRIFWMLLWSGVLERHPRLQIVFTEQFADWVGDLLYKLDEQYGGAVAAMTRPEGLSMRPSEYWKRQCHVGGSFLSRRECERRHAIGVGNLLWGADFPHDEGTWPNTLEALHTTFDGVPEDELRAMLGENAARLYGFDTAALAPHVARVGLDVASFQA